MPNMPMELIGRCCQCGRWFGLRTSSAVGGRAYQEGRQTARPGALGTVRGHGYPFFYAPLWRGRQRCPGAGQYPTKVAPASLRYELCDHEVPQRVLRELQRIRRERSLRPPNREDLRPLRPDEVVGLRPGDRGLLREVDAPGRR